MAEAAFFRIGRSNFHFGQATVVIREPTVLREQFGPGDWLDLERYQKKF
jgi:hypothetical protein